MYLIKALFDVARGFSHEADLQEIEKIERKAEQQTSKYLPEDKGFKGLLARANEGWLIPLLAVFAVPFLTNFLINKRDELLIKRRDVDDMQDGVDFDDLDEFDDFEDDFSEEELERMQDRLDRLRRD